MAIVVNTRETPALAYIRCPGSSRGGLLVDGLEAACGELTDDIGVRFEDGNTGGFVMSVDDLRAVLAMVDARREFRAAVEVKP